MIWLSCSFSLIQQFLSLISNVVRSSAIISGDSFLLKFKDGHFARVCPGCPGLRFPCTLAERKLSVAVPIIYLGTGQFLSLFRGIILSIPNSIPFKGFPIFLTISGIFAVQKTAFGEKNYTWARSYRGLFFKRTFLSPLYSCLPLFHARGYPLHLRSTHSLVTAQACPTLLGT